MSVYIHNTDAFNASMIDGKAIEALFDIKMIHSCRFAHTMELKVQRLSVLILQLVGRETMNEIYCCVLA